MKIKDSLNKKNNKSITKIFGNDYLNLNKTDLEKKIKDYFNNQPK